eukprot:4202333-Ditylum_brightwellii.AAC.1
MSLCKAVSLYQMIEKKIELPENSLFTHFGGCSNATSLTDADISLTNLKRASRWALQKAHKEYLEHSHATKMDRLNMLMHGSDTKQRAAATERVALPNIFNPLQLAVSTFSMTEVTPSAQDSTKVSELDKNHVFLPLIVS